MAVAQSEKTSDQRQIIEAVGKAIGKQAKAFNAQLNELRQQITPSVIIEHSLGIVRRGLDALMDEVNEQGEDCTAYCERHYAQPLGDALAEYYFSSGLPFTVPLQLADGQTLVADRKAQRYDRLRFLLLAETERIVGAPIVRGRMIRGHIDISRVAALNRNDPSAILETSASHIFLIAKAERLRSFADGLRDAPLGDPRTLRFRSLLEEATSLGANTDVIRRLRSRMVEVTEALEASADEWEAASVKYGRDAYRQAHAAHIGKTDTPLAPPSSVHDRYGECAARYVAGEAFRLMHLGGGDAG